MAGPARTVPTARPLPSGFGTLVETRMYSSPPFTKSVAVIPLPSSLPTASTISNLLLILVVPKYRAGASLPPTASFPSSLGAPNFAVMAVKVSIDFVTLGSACACPTLGISIKVATKHPAARMPTKKLSRFILHGLPVNGARISKMRSLLHPRSFVLLYCLLAYRRQRLPIVEWRIRHVAVLLAALGENGPACLF